MSQTEKVPSRSERQRTEWVCTCIKTVTQHLRGLSHLDWSALFQNRSLFWINLHISLGQFCVHTALLEGRTKHTPLLCFPYALMSLPHACRSGFSLWDSVKTTTIAKWIAGAARRGNTSWTYGQISQMLDTKTVKFMKHCVDEREWLGILC